MRQDDASRPTSRVQRDFSRIGLRAATAVMAERDWLVGGGEAAHRIRAMNWAHTPLGPREQWPASLRMALNLVLAGSFPMAIAWGPELRLLYNDSYAAIAGTKHPA